MVACGPATLPRDAAPCLSFREAGTPQSVWDLYELSPGRFGTHRERLSRLTVIGSDGAGNPICVRGDSGPVVMLDHENLPAGETFVNSSVAQLAECLLAYLGERDPERFRSAVRAIDAPAMAERTFWCFEADGLIEDAEGDEVLDRLRKERPTARSAGPLGQVLAALARIFRRGQ